MKTTEGRDDDKCRRRRRMKTMEGRDDDKRRRRRVTTKTSEDDGAAVGAVNAWQGNPYVGKEYTPFQLQEEQMI